MKQLDICRCCLAVGCDKDISAAYEEDGRTEVYSDMLLDTFNIFISYEDIGGTCQICDYCIARLRDAAEFKKQVVEAGKTIAQSVRGQIKLEEVSEYEIIEDGINQDVVYEDIKQMEDEAEISYEGFNLDAGDTNEDDEAIYIISLDSKIDGGDLEVMNDLAKSIFAPPKPEGRRKKRRTRPKKEKPNVKKRPEVTQTHIDMRANTLKLIRNSNMCLFKAGRAKFGCFYCYETYKTMPELKEHSKIHSHTKELVIKINPVTGLAYKRADISSLHCNRCLEPCEDLQALQDHLTLIHDFTFSNAGHLLIPFKLDNALNCAICGLICNTFAFLSMHMNSHFPNYVCEICGAAYINFKNLDVHKRIVHLRKCKKCVDKDKCLCDTEVKVGLKPNKRTCIQCNLIFRYSYLLKEHNYHMHGAKRPIATCNICFKTFLTPNNLKLHVRRVHNAERNHVCKICDMSFFTGHGMKKHIRRTHTDIEVKPYSCNFCVCKFKMKYSLSKHLKNRHGRRMDGSLFDEVAMQLEEIDP